MARNSRSGRTLITTAAVACLWAGASSAGAQEQRPPTPVSIVESVPLPISGTVTVGAGASVTVNNTDAAPVPTRDVDRVAREVFQTSIVPTAFSGSVGTSNVVTVPAGKRLVVEYASAWVNASAAGGLLGANLSIGFSNVNGLPCLPQGQNALNYVYVCAGPTRQYVNAGETLRFGVETFASAGGFFRVFVSGYYEPAP